MWFSSFTPSGSPDNMLIHTAHKQHEMKIMTNEIYAFLQLSQQIEKKDEL